MAKTATVHNPTNFEPTDYIVEDYLDNRRPEYFMGESVDSYRQVVRMWEDDMQRALGADWRAKANHCVHCGNGNVRWITAVRHTPTGEVVVFGSDCTDRLGFANKVAFKLALLKSRAEARTESLRVWKAREEFLNAHPEIRTAIAELDNAEHAKNFFVKDVIAKLDRYGSLSDKQVAAVLSSLARDVEKANKAAVEAAEPKGDGPVGRIEVTGLVLAVKEHESQFGFSLKMLVKLENNSKVWVTVPSGSDIKRDDRVTVRASWTQSKDDKSFSFGSRPYLVDHTPAAEKSL